MFSLSKTFKAVKNLQGVRKNISASFSSSPPFDQICELAASKIRFGQGATKEVGKDLVEGFNAKRVAVFTDAHVGRLPQMDTLLESLEMSKVQYVVYDQVRVEPTDVSFRHAIDFLSQQQQSYDAVVAFGGGSVMDTAKAANLYATLRPDDFYEFVNHPFGKGSRVPASAALPPVIAIPTTAGTGSEATGNAVFFDSPSGSKTGIADRALKPNLGIIDPDNTASLPPLVAAYSGLDVLCHAIESYTALPYQQRVRPDSPLLRPAFQGSNPISDVWSMFALETCAKELPRAVSEGDEDSRGRMLLSSAVAGVGFGNAGVHLPHGMGYPISSQVKPTYKLPSDYEACQPPNSGDEMEDHPHDMVPHGLSVVVSAPAVAAFTGIADPERHMACARALANARGDNSHYQIDATRRASGDFAGKWLADEIRILVKERLGLELGLKQFGFVEDDIPSLAKATMLHQRVTKISPRPVGERELEELFYEVMNEE